MGKGLILITRINVKDALADKNSIFYYYQKLIELRPNAGNY